MTPIMTTNAPITMALIAAYAVWWWRLIAFGGHTF